MEVVENSLGSSARGLIQIIVPIGRRSRNPDAPISVGLGISVSRCHLLCGGGSKDRVLNVDVVGIVVD